MHSNPLLEAVMAQANPAKAQEQNRFFKTERGQYAAGDRFLGLTNPTTRSIVKQMWRDATFAQLEACLQSEWHEVRLAALLVLVQQYQHAKKNPDMQQRCIDFYLAHLEAVNNWDLVDLTCYDLLGTHLLHSDASLLYAMAAPDRTLWEQRIAIVSTMQFVRHGRLDDTLAIADLLLHHPHDLIHKAVGWLLREVGKRDLDRLLTFLGPRHRTMPRTMLRYAIEKLPPEQRQLYLHGKVVEVVCAIIADGSLRLATQRAHGEWSGWWEFPGGKVEIGESLPQAVQREIREELGVELQVGRRIEVVEWDYPTFHLRMHCFEATLRGDQPLLLHDHTAARWVEQSALAQLQWLPADKALVERLATEAREGSLVE